MGAVYLARDKALDRQVALKVLHVDGEAAPLVDPHALGETALTTDAPPTPKTRGIRSTAVATVEGRRLIDRLLREARAAARVQHAHAVAIFDVGEVGGTPYLAMEFVAGETLRSRMSRGGASFEQFVAWLFEVAEALAAAHGRGVVHRDVKPENVMIRDDGAAKVVDFGIARAASLPAESRHDESPSTLGLLGGDAQHPTSRVSERSHVAGTLAYMAPEQLRGETVDGRADQFAWGVLAYELLVGLLPWSGGRDAIASQILSRDPVPSGPLEAAVPPRVARTIARAMEKDPNLRYASMAELVRHLHAACSGQHADDSAELRRARPLSAKIAVALAVLLAFGVAALDSGVTAVATPGRTAEAPIHLRGSKMTAVTEALAEYRAGIDATRGAAAESARSHFERATELDPTFAAAHLRKALMTINLDDVAREHVSRAFQLRADLDEHDRALLYAVEPWTRVPQSIGETLTKLEVRMRDDPDADNALQLCRFQFIAGDYRAAIASCTAAAERDPGMAAAFWLRGDSYMYLDDVVAGRQDLERCIALSPDGTSCIYELSSLYAGEGRCAEALPFGHRMVDSGLAWLGWELVAATLLRIDAPQGDVRDAVAHEIEALAPSTRRTRRAFLDTMLALADGDLIAGRRALDAWERAIEAASNEEDHYQAFQVEAALAEEAGDSAAATEAARRYLSRRTAWTPTDGLDSSITALTTMRRHGALSSAEFAAQRDTWFASTRSATAGHRGMTAGAYWTLGYAAASVTAEEARAALDALPSFQPLPPQRTRTPPVDWAIGRTYLIAQRAADALPYLRRAAHSCFGLTFPIDQARAQLDLGAALAALGERDEACRVYTALGARWHHPSVTADAARREARSCRR